MRFCLALALLGAPLASCAPPAPPLSSVTGILESQAVHEYAEDEDIIWPRAMRHEWDRSEARARRKLREGTGARGTDGMMSALLCSDLAGDGVDGWSRRGQVLELLGTSANLKSVYNGERESCWRAWLSHEQAIEASSAPSLSILPFSHALRLQSGFLHHSVGATPDGPPHSKLSVATTAKGLTLDLCPGAHAGPDEKEAFAAAIEASVADLFSPSSSTHAELLEDFFWTASNGSHRRSLRQGVAPVSAAHADRYGEALRATGEDASGCLEKIGELGFEADPLLNDLHITGVSEFYSAISTATSTATADSCFVTLALYLSSSLPEVCHLAGRSAVEIKNVEAQWVTQSGDTFSQSRPLWDAGIEGQGQVVACSDSGLDVDNCYFRDATGSPSKNTSPTSFDSSKRKVVQYYAQVDRSDEEEGHGTHVVGSIVGHKSTNGRANGESTGMADGVARGAKVAFFDIGGVNSNGQGYLSVPQSSAAIFDPGYNAGARIHSASWGDVISPWVDGALTDDSYGYGFGAVDDALGMYRRSNLYAYQDSAFDAYMHDKEDFLILVAAGNDGTAYPADGSDPTTDDLDDLNSVSSPSNGKNIVSVGATQNAGTHVYPGMGGIEYVADFSSRGPTRDGRTKPDILAPGYFILSAAARGGGDGGQSGECDPGSAPADPGSLLGTEGIAYSAGTSMATPVTSGATALVRQYFVDGYYPTGAAVNANKMSSPSAALLKAVLMNSGTEMTGVQNFVGGISVTPTSAYDEHEAFGRVTLDRTLRIAGHNDISTLAIDQESLASSEFVEYEFTIGTCSDADDLSIMLTWTDVEGSPLCLDCLINDLDLVVRKKSGSQWGSPIYANGKTTLDTLNNAERVRVSNPSPGDVYKATVTATSLDSASQKFALVASGCFTAEDEGISEGTPAPSASPTPVPTLQPGHTRAPTASPTAHPTSSPTAAPVDNSGTFCEIILEFEDLLISGAGLSVDVMSQDEVIKGFQTAVAEIAGETVGDFSYVCFVASEVAASDESEDPPSLPNSQAWGGERRTTETEVLSVDFTITAKLADYKSCQQNNAASVAANVHAAEVMSNVWREIRGGTLKHLLDNDVAFDEAGVSSIYVDFARLTPTDTQQQFTYNWDTSTETDRHCTGWKIKQWLADNLGLLIGAGAGGICLICACIGITIACMKGKSRRNKDKYKQKTLQMQNHARMPAKSPMHAGGRAAKGSVLGSGVRGVQTRNASNASANRPAGPPPGAKYSNSRNAAPAGRTVW